MEVAPAASVASSPPSSRMATIRLDIFIAFTTISFNILTLVVLTKDFRGFTALRICPECFDENFPYSFSSFHNIFDKRQFHVFSLKSTFVKF